MPKITKAVFASIFAAFLISILNAEARPCTTVKIEEGVRLGDRWSCGPSIIKLSDGRYRMYYSDASGEQNYPLITKSAVSTDGLFWIKEEGVRIGAGHGGQDGWAVSAEVKKLSDGTYRMYFSTDINILSAVSKDGLIWAKEEGVRVINDSFSQKVIQGSCVVTLPFGGYRMYYSAHDGKSARIFSAISFDGLVWAKESGTRLGLEENFISVSSPKVIRDSFGRYIMFYYACPPDTLSGHIRSAISIDGLKWYKQSGILVDAKAVKDGPYSTIYPGDLVKISESQYRLYFSADRCPQYMYDRLRIFSAIVTILPPNNDVFNVITALSFMKPIGDRGRLIHKKTKARKTFDQHLKNSLEHQIDVLTNNINEFKKKSTLLENDLQRIRSLLDLQ